MNPLREFHIYGGYGLLSSGRKRSVRFADAGVPADLKPIDWSGLFIPTYNQRGPSCASEASANILEAWIRFFHGKDAILPGHQIDGYALHKVLCDMFNNGDLEQGACLNWPFEAMIEMGMIPQTTQLVEIQPTLPAIVRSLQDGPLLQGLWVGPAWSAASNVNGQIPEGWTIDASDHEQGGHATVMTGYEPRRRDFEIASTESVDWLPLVNSWGMDFGWKGTAVLSWAEWQREHAPIGDGPYQFVFPPEFKDFDGWRKYIIKKT